LISRNLRAIWAYRNFLAGSIKREFDTKYRNSVLGMAWMFLNPAATIAIYTVIFSRVFAARFPNGGDSLLYAIHLCAGVLAWSLFHQIVDRSLTMFMANANLLKKINFPRICLPVITLCSALIDYAVVNALFVAVLLVSGHFPGFAFLAILPATLILTMIATGFGLAMGTLNLFFRDTEQIVRIFLQFLFWLTPIVYPPSALPEQARAVIGWNPLAPLMNALQNAVALDQWPDWRTLLYPLLIGLLLCAFGMQLFRRHSEDLADEL
jgi:lipopolysaccharide transport system permease protein